MPGSRVVVTKSEEADRADIYSGGRPTVHVWCLVMGNDSCLSGTPPLSSTARLHSCPAFRHLTPATQGTECRAVFLGVRGEGEGCWALWRTVKIQSGIRWWRLSRMTFDKPIFFLIIERRHKKFKRLRMRSCIGKEQVS